MIIGPRRLALIGTIVAVALAIIFYPLIVRTPIDLERVTIELTKLTLASGGQGDESLTLRPTFTLTNDNDFTLTTSRIDYELFVDGTSIGTGTLSYEDVPVNGRPPLFAGTSVSLLVPESQAFKYTYSDSRADIFNRILSNSTQTEWSVTGTAIIESGTSFETKQFSDNM